LEVQKEWVDNDYYAILGVTKEATSKEVTSAYRKAAKKYHPDANSGDKAAENKFKEVASAFEVLGNPDKRKSYDQVREMVNNGGFSGGGGGGPFGGGFSTGGSSHGINIEDIFSNLFGGGGGGFTTSSGGQTRAQVGDDLETAIQLSFEEALSGSSKDVTFRAEADCDTCDGNGTKSGEKPPICHTCKGSGTTQQSKGFFAFEQTCSTCRGAGFNIADPCGTCRGQGRIIQNRTETIPIPKGIDNNQRIRLRGRGGAGYLGGPAGDLFVLIRVEQHKLFHREGLDLYLSAPITYVEASLGSEVEIPTPYGSAKIKVPSGTSTGDKVRVKGKGISTDRSTGDMYVIFEVQIPRKLNKKQKKLLEELATELEEEPRKEFANYL
jgi:molecular chaperone DnaJ